jgi:hypothetical protein
VSALVLVLVPASEAGRLSGPHAQASTIVATSAASLRLTVQLYQANTRSGERCFWVQRSQASSGVGLDVDREAPNVLAARLDAEAGSREFLGASATRVGHRAAGHNPLRRTSRRGSKTRVIAEIGSEGAGRACAAAGWLLVVCSCALVVVAVALRDRWQIPTPTENGRLGGYDPDSRLRQSAVERVVFTMDCP